MENLREIFISAESCLSPVRAIHESPLLLRDRYTTTKATKIAKKESDLSTVLRLLSVLRVLPCALLKIQCGVDKNPHPCPLAQAGEGNPPALVESKNSMAMGEGEGDFILCRRA
jgi:hypothetical protein